MQGSPEIPIWEPIVCPWRVDPDATQASQRNSGATWAGFVRSDIKAKLPEKDKWQMPVPIRSAEEQLL